jgi:hypothetical protein
MKSFKTMFLPTVVLICLVINFGCKTCNCPSYSKIKSKDTHVLQHTLIAGTFIFLPNFQTTALYTTTPPLHPTLNFDFF